MKRKQDKVKKLKIVKQTICGYGWLILLIVSCLYFFLYVRPHQIDGQSMSPILSNKDHLLIIKNERPDRYDMITFVPENKGTVTYVKRVIGVPGDRIWLDNKTLYINENQLETGNKYIESNQFLSGDDLPDSTLKVWVTEETAKKLANLKEIPADNYFVLGDNRSYSEDSRHFGLVEKKQIEGTVFFRYYPFGNMGFLQ